MNEMSITAPFVCLDDFAILFEQGQRHHMIPSERRRFRQGRLSLGECMFIMALFHCSPYSNFKRFRKHGVDGVYRGYFGDQGCISRKLFQKLCKRRLKLVTGIRRNMINCLMPLEDKLLLRQRRVIETLFGRLKEDMRLEHSRRRSATNALVHIVSCLAACILNGNPVGMRGLS